MAFRLSAPFTLATDCTHIFVWCDFSWINRSHVNGTSRLVIWLFQPRDSEHLTDFASGDCLVSPIIVGCKKAEAQKKGVPQKLLKNFSVWRVIAASRFGDVTHSIRKKVWKGFWDEAIMFNGPVVAISAFAHKLSFKSDFNQFWSEMGDDAEVEGAF